LRCQFFGVNKGRNFLVRIVFRLFATLWLCALSGQAMAALTFELRTGKAATNTQSMLIDSNQCPAKGPVAMYVGGVITNTGTAAVTDIVASMTGLNSNVYLAGGQLASQSIGTLDAGESIGVYWFTGYGCTENATATPLVQLSSSLGSQATSLTLTIRKAISANAGGNVASSTLGPGAVVGQTVFYDAVYDFGGTASGDEYFLQPAGGQNFNAACFRLTGSEIVASNLNAATVGTKNTMYFVQSGAQPGNNKSISIRYFFEYLCAGVSAVARPYAVQTSGNTNIKYTGNFDGTGSISITYPGATNPFTITKSVSESYAWVGTSGQLIYTVTITNPSIHPSVISKIVDVLPAGMTYGALASGSDVTIANSSSVPPAGTAGTLTFLGRLGRSYAIAGGASVVLKYTANRPGVAGSFTNTAQGYLGLASTAVAQATYQQIAVVPLVVTKTSSVRSDGISLANPKAIPGAYVDYTITVTNPNLLPLDANSVEVRDSTPANTEMCVNDFAGANSGPVVFSDGTPASGLGYSFVGLSDLSDNLQFSSDGGVTWNYVPTADAFGCDSAITDFRVTTSNADAAGGVFKLMVKYRIF
jgi:uncharacterized repeat protein (TIGR01451 family)